LLGHRCSHSGEIEPEMNPRASGPAGEGRVAHAVRRNPVTFHFEGHEVQAYEGETVGAALLAAGERTLRSTARRSEPRGLFCTIGVCYDCLIRVGGRMNVRACREPVKNGLEVWRSPGFLPSGHE
jgi:hypothetical protein